MPKYAEQESAKNPTATNGAIKLLVNPMPIGKPENKNDAMFALSANISPLTTKKAPVNIKQRCNVE